MIIQIWIYVVKPELEKRAKSTHSRIDDFIIQKLDEYIIGPTGASESSVEAGTKNEIKETKNKTGK